ncbi:MAG TPA: FHA domain-containing serine/threonine-protein kinase [Ktedonobacteraceae bacterium]|nr:FHA domain-containing serine/threonine-protein kinase [Ktedonobacteraceae bacterium]
MVQRNPRVIGGLYQIGQVITSGPLLTIYSAYNRNSSDVVGLYVIELPSTLDEESVQGLLQPLEKRRNVQSPHAMHVYDWGIAGTRAYIATDPPRGINLRQVLDTENIDIQRALGLARQLARGLAAIQAQGIVDVDMRPQLVTIDNVGTGVRAQLDDIGLRLMLKQLGYMHSQRGDDIGYLDPRYAAPESIQHGQIGMWSDVYQLGLLIYETVTGRLPFVGRTPAETEMMQVASPVPPMAQFNPETPRMLQELVDRALAKNPAQRFPNAVSLLQALEAQTLSNPLAQQDSASLTPTPGSLPAIKVAVQTSEMSSVSPIPEDASLSDTLIENDSTITRLAADDKASATQEEHALAYLYFEPEGGATRRFAIKSNYIVVGRLDPKRGLTPEVDLSSVDTTMTVSRQHARIRYEKTFFTIEDLKSRNKTCLNERTLMPLKAELLRHGDVVHFGSVRMIFKVPDMTGV